MNNSTMQHPTVSLRDLARNVSDVFRIAEYKPITVTRYGKPIAQIIPNNSRIVYEDEDVILTNRSIELVEKIKKVVVKKYKNKPLPSLEEQLA